MINKRAYSTLLFILAFLNGFVSAQVDTLHYLPPLYYTGNTNNDYGDQYLLLSTFETIPFSVRVRTRDGSYDQTFSISQSTPAQIDMGYQFAAVGLIGPTQKNTPLNDEGLIVSGPEPFFVNVTHKTSIQACIITSKGTVGLGKEFYAGFMASVLEDNNASNSRNKRRSHFISVMATENNTFVTFNNPRVQWDGHPSSSFTVSLQAGQSYVVTKDFHNSGLNNTTVNHFNGTKVTSNKPVSVISGSWTSAMDKGVRDIGLDQIVPIDIVGDEYIVLRGNGSNLVERVIVVSVGGTNNIYLNGSSTPYATLNGAGDYVIIPENQYSGNDNMYIQTDTSVYVYQSLAGSNSNATTGMVFVPRLSCSVDKEVQISYADFLGNPEIKLVTQTGSSITINGVSIGGGESVSGNSFWESYSINKGTLATCNPGPDWNFTIQSTGALNAALTIESGAIGAGGYYSGFGTVPEISFNPVLELSGFCAGNAKLTASGYSDYNWYKDGIIIPGETQSEYYPHTPGRYKVVGITTCAGQPGYTYPSGEVIISPCLSVHPDSISIQEGDILNPNATFTIELSHQWDEDDVTFDYATIPGTATQGVDYLSTNGTITIESGNQSVTIDVPIQNDLLAEDIETLELEISNPDNAIIKDKSGTIFIEDDGDPKPQINLGASKTVNENAGTVSYNVTLDRLSGQTIRADYTISDNTATRPSDYSRAAGYSGTLTFAPGELTKIITINIFDDNIHEPGANEQFVITLSNIVNATLGNLVSITSIVDNESTPTMTLSADNVAEGDTLFITGTLSHPSNQNITFNYFTLNDVATSPDDYTALPLTADTLRANALSFSVGIVTVDDITLEGSEPFLFVVQNLQYAAFAGPALSDTVTPTILDNEGLPQISVSNATGTEGENIGINLTVSHPSSTDIIFEFHTTGLSATEDVDYTGTNPAQVFIIPANQLHDTIIVASIEDTDEEGNENFEVYLNNVSSNALFNDSVAMVTIIDNDDTPVANSDLFSTNEDTPLTENVFDNDAGFGDMPVGIIMHSLPMHGHIHIDSTTGVFTYTPSADYFGGDSLKYTIEDADGDQSSAWVIVSVLSQNDIPVAVRDTFFIAEEETLDTTVLYNDYGLGDGIDNIAVTSPPASGTLNFSANGDFTYTPVAEFYGIRNFTYEITDGNGNHTFAIVRIVVAYSNDYDPVAVNDTISTPEDDPVTISVLSNDYDTDGQSTIDPGSVNIVTTPQNGNAVVNYITGIVTYTPDTDFQGNDYFEYQISDAGSRTSNTARVVITVTGNNDVPVALCHDSVEGYLDSNGSFILETALVNNNSFDNDGDPLVYSFNTSNFSCSDIGHHTITMTVRDPMLAQSQCTSILNLRDTTLPVITFSPNDTIIYSDGTTCGQKIFYSRPEFTDNCGGIQFGTLKSGYTSGSDFPVGITNIKYSYTDPSGNGPVSVNFNIELRDTVSPVVSCNSDTVFVSAGNTYNIAGNIYDPSVTESCSHSIVNDFNGSTTLNGASLNKGIHQITWTATDAQGNAGTCVQTIHVYDSLTITLLSSDDNDTICEGETIIFTAMPTGGMGTYTYQFYVNNIPVSNGVTGNTLTISDLVYTQTHNVYAEVTDVYGNAESSATLQVKVWKQPATGGFMHIPNGFASE